MLDKYIEINNLSFGSKPFDDIRQGLPLAIFGLSNSSKCHFVSLIEGKVLFVLKDRYSVIKTKEILTGFTSKKIVTLLEKSEVLIPLKGFQKDILFERITAFNEMKTADIVLTTFEGLMQFIPKTLFSFTLKKGESYNQEEIIKTLTKIGYDRESFAESKGSFSVRGDILDIFPINVEYPVRIDFFGDEIEKIKVINEEKEEISLLEVLTATDGIIDNSEEVYERLKIEKQKLLKRENSAKLRGKIEELIESSPSFLPEEFLPVLNSGSIFDYFPNPVVVFDEPKQLKDFLSVKEKEHNDRFDALFKEGEVFSFAKDQLKSGERVLEELVKQKVVALSQITTVVGFFNPLSVCTFSTAQSPKYKLKFNELNADLMNWIRTGYTVIVAGENEKQLERLDKEFTVNQIPYSYNNFVKGKINVLPLGIKEGVIYHDTKLVIIGSGDLFLTENKTLKRKKSEVFFSAPDVGDYVVHEIHGIGKVTGIKKISSTESTKDYISIIYAGGDVLYVPAESFDSLTKYVGAEKEPKLSKIGGRDFEKTLEKVKASIKKMSFDLKELYDKRSRRIGYEFIKDEEMMGLFSSAFPYELTADQQDACADIEKDMCSKKVMDRLICGDVGFGKTEVAFRATFLAILNHKQVAFLAPTTLLTEQHFKTATERFKDFGINIAVLNRFKRKKEQEEIIKKVKEGQIDLIIGTHRLFSKDIAFKDLGLLILDEEQRFGVEHKEKIKRLKDNVDTLTLSATPIPRTLNISLTGIRDISIINTPPKERLPVQTYVVEESNAIIKDAIDREIARGGQVFVLYNRVETIEVFANKLKEFINHKIIVAHGQMKEETLENNVLAFSRKEADVLVSTTIIENGIDMPSVNTIIVIDADRLGLSTLYQLKGRVGRGTRLASAYFTFKENKVISETAYQRLMAIMEFVKMSSGFKIAMRDLEIRGAGTVLGREQHGHMEKVGYELYSKLLKESLEDKVEEKEVELDIRVSAFIPNLYIEKPSVRMDVYKKIAEVTDEKALREELKEVFGKLPKEVDNLINIAVIKKMATNLGAKGVTINKEEVSISFENLKEINNPKLLNSIDENSSVLSLEMAKSPKILFKKIFSSSEKMLVLVYDFLKGVI
ncbi:MAG: transcription-repair coupling factor [Clostridiales bacterium]|nr:transcription-repair coupling factor [Clostridiales bacterium]